ncbi:hypothetical protein [Helicobacter trogontum]
MESIGLQSLQHLLKALHFTRIILFLDSDRNPSLSKSSIIKTFR